ncbi:MAG: permease prefix domain 1-containing protein [Planctomycetota bacterium]
MARHDDLVDRLTHRLRVDPELRADVAGELRAHLDDAAAEYRRGGYSDEDAAAEAVRALGDADDLARQLWQANRRRIVLRRVCKWAARVALVPGAIAVIALVVWGVRPRQFGDFVGSTSLVGGDVVDRMTDEQRLIVLGDTDADTYVDAQKALVERWPENPVFRANYVAAYLAARKAYLPRYTPEGLRATGDTTPNWDEPPLDDVRTDDPEAVLAGTLAELDRAAAADPDNALYPMLRAALRFQAAGRERYTSQAIDETEPSLPYVEIGDRARFDRALDDIRLAASKPHYATYQADLARLRLEAIPPSQRLMDTVILSSAMANRSVQIWLPTSGLQRDWARMVYAYTMQLAAEGHHDEALARNRQFRRLAAIYGAGAETTIDMMVAMAVYALAADNEAELYEAMGRTDRAEALKRRNERVHDLHTGFLPLPDNAAVDTRALGWTHWMTRAYYADPEPIRAAEYAVLEQMVLIALLAIVLVVALLAVVATGIGLLRRRTGRPRLLFVGWPAIGRICLYAIAAPLAVYVLYTRVAPFSPQRYGAWYTAERVAVELVAFVAAVLGLLVGLTYSAVRRRAATAGLEVPAPRRLRDRKVFVAIGGLLLLASLVYVWNWERADAGRGAWDILAAGGPVLAGAIGAALLGWLIHEGVFVLRLPRRLASFRRTLMRSSIGVFAAAIILIGTICGVSLRRVEGVNVAHLTETDNIGLANEVELSPMRHLRAWFVRRHDTLMADEDDTGQTAAAPARPEAQRAKPAQTGGAP